MRLTEIIESNFSLTQQENINVLKIRVKNSEQNIGKRGGYRLIALINEKQQTIVFLFLYPKQGSYGKENFDKIDELTYYLETFHKELKENNLMSIDINTMELKNFKTE